MMMAMTATVQVDVRIACVKIPFAIVIAMWKLAIMTTAPVLVIELMDALMPCVRIPFAIVIAMWKLAIMTTATVVKVPNEILDV